MSELKPRAIKRFWAKVGASEAGCWEWQGTKLQGRWRGYGTLMMGTKTYLAHRFSWMLHFGDIPHGQCVLHRCDNPGCVRPTHLFLGSRIDNNQDRETKGRGVSVFGENNGRSKLTPGAVSKIKKHLVVGDKSLAELGRENGVRWQTIQAIAMGKTWKTI